jgi:hypothetical protein
VMTDLGAPVSGRPRRRILALLLVGALIAGCGGPERIEWPGLRADLPDGWEVITEDRDRLVLADHLVAEGGRGVLITFLRVPGTLPDDWRLRVAERGATVESDGGVLIAGDVPATQLIITDVVNGIPVREALLVVASRGLVISVTPRVLPGELDGPTLLLESLDGVRALLDVAELAPATLG